jgi:hypothetical protein
MATIVINRNATDIVVAIIPSDDDTSGIPTLEVGAIEYDAKISDPIPPTVGVDTTVGTGDVSSVVVVVVVDVPSIVGRSRHSPSSPKPASNAPKSQ